MIVRIWHGWTTLENAPVYEALLRTEIFPGIAAKGVAGYRGVRLLRREIPGGRTADGHPEVEFATVMEFDSMDAVRAFAGEDPERAYVPESARAVLKRFEARSRHYQALDPDPGD